jgi:hypothetical protein
MNVRDILEQCGMADEHFATLGRAIPEGYAALQSLAAETPMFSQFLPGSTSLGYLRNIAVQYALQAKAATTGHFYISNAMNKARNHTFLKLQFGQTIFTSHYAGPRGTRGVRKSISRAEMIERNGDLFRLESDLPDADMLKQAAYAQIVHGGKIVPVFAAIFIPNRDQRASKLEPLILSLEKPNSHQVEEVKDRLAETIKKKAKDKNDNAKTG